MPVWNGGATLAAALESLLAQSLAHFEIIVVDDGSTDETPHILNHYAARDSRVRPLRIAHGGIVAALNHGLAHVRAPLVARMDADDICHPHRLALQVAHLDTHPGTGLVASRVTFGGDRTTAGGLAHHVDWMNTLLTHEAIALARFRESPLAHPSVMFRTALVAQHGGYAEGPFPEDYELWLRWLDAGVRMEKLSQELVVWNDPPTRLTRTHANYAPEAFTLLRTHFLARWLHAHNPHGPDIWVVGAGRASRGRARPLQQHNIHIRAWIDIDPRKIGNIVEGLPVIGRDAMPRPGQGFLVAFLGGHGAGDELAAFLDGAGYLPGRDYLLAS